MLPTETVTPILLRIPFLLGLLLLFPTRMPAQDPGLITIDIPTSIRNKGEVKLSEIASDIEFIQLETTKDCLINSEQSDCFISGQYILVVSRKPAGAMVFDRNGKFLRRIGQVGKGPNEYTCLDAACIDPLGKFIFLTDPQGKIDNQLDCIKKMKVMMPERRDDLVRKIQARTEYDNPMLVVMRMKL